MIGNLVRNWWAFVVQGVLAIGVGVAAFAIPGATLAAFLVVFGAYAIVGGLFEIAGGFSMPNGPKWSLVLGGIASIAVGAITFASPASTAVAAALLVGIYAIAIGFARLSASYTLGRLGNTWALGRRRTGVAPTHERRVAPMGPPAWNEQRVGVRAGTT